MRILFIVPAKGSTGELRTVLPIIAKARELDIECFCFIHQEAVGIVPQSLRTHFLFWEDGEHLFQAYLNKCDAVIFADYSNFNLLLSHSIISLNKILAAIDNKGIKLATLDYFGLCLNPQQKPPPIPSLFQFGSPFLRKILEEKSKSFYTNVPIGMKIFRPCPFNHIASSAYNIHCYFRYADQGYYESERNITKRIYRVEEDQKIFIQIISGWVEYSLKFIYATRAHDIGKVITGVIYHYLEKIYGNNFLLVNISPFSLDRKNVINKKFISENELFSIVKEATLVISYNIYSGVLMDCIFKKTPVMSVHSNLPISKEYLTEIKGSISTKQYKSIIDLLGDQVFPPFKALGLYYENALVHLLENNPYFESIPLLDLFDEEQTMQMLSKPSCKSVNFSIYENLPSFWDMFFNRVL